MKIDVNNAFTLLSLISMIVVGIYQLAQIEASINSKISKSETNLLIAIDSFKDSLVEKVNLLDRKVDTHLTEYKGDKEYIYLYRLNDNERTIEHKFNRLANWITQMAELLQRKYGFQIRDDKF